MVPLNRKYPLRELLDACRHYPGVSNARRITFEYVMLKGINDSLGRRQGAGAAAQGHSGQDQSDSVQSLAGQPNTNAPTGSRSRNFREIVFDAGYASPVRTPRGRDILAACGQLKSATEKLSARERLALRAMAVTD